MLRGFVATATRLNRNVVVTRGLSDEQRIGYVERMRILDYWKMQDGALQNEFQRSRLLLMVDGKVLVTDGDENAGIRMIEHTYPELTRKLGEYGLQFDVTTSCLIDAIVPESSEPSIDVVPLFGTAISAADPPPDSPVSKREVLSRMARGLGGKLVHTRIAMLTMSDTLQRHRLAKFSSIQRWTRVYRRCPQCAAVLRVRVSKSGAECVSCARMYYPQFSPVAITLITDPTGKYALLARHRGSANGVFTAVAGFAHTGESLEECARREIAEEVGIEVRDVRSLDMSQPWPMPDSSLMVAHLAVAEMNQKIDVCPEELETAVWFDRDAVRAALKTTLSDRFLRKLPKSVEERQKLHYIPPAGAIAHVMIRDWVEGKYDGIISKL